MRFNLWTLILLLAFVALMVCPFQSTDKLGERLIAGIFSFLIGCYGTVLLTSMGHAIDEVHGGLIAAIVSAVIWCLGLAAYFQFVFEPSFLSIVSLLGQIVVVITFVFTIVLRRPETSRSANPFLDEDEIEDERSAQLAKLKKAKDSAGPR